MDMLKHLNAAMQFVEENLCQDIDLDEVAEIACVTKDSLLRFFSYMTGMTLKDYIRRRRLSLAALELKNTQNRIIDIALKYGWESSDSFTKAFVRQHNQTPSEVRAPHPPRSFEKSSIAISDSINAERSLKLYSPAIFQITIKGAREVDFRLIELPETQLYGIAKPFDGQGYTTREELRHEMWAEDLDNIPGHICSGNWNEPRNHSYDGIWYGIWNDGKYFIARDKENAQTENIDKLIIPHGTYAAFRTERGGLAWEEFPKLFDLIFDSWLPSSGYKHKTDIIIEVLHLWTNRDERKKNRYYEVWIPVERVGE